MAGQDCAVSVVLPTHNRAHMLERSVGSILSQTFADFELLVVDDGSEDDTGATLAAFGDDRIRHLRLPVNCGSAIARNLGLRVARGRYAAVMDSDDAAEPERLQAQFDVMEARPDIHILGSSVVKVLPERNVPMRCPAEDGVIKARLIEVSGSCMIHPSSFLRMDFLREKGLSYPVLTTDSDHGFWLDAALAGARFSSVPRFLLRYYRHGDNATSASRPDFATHLQHKRALRQRIVGCFFPGLTGREAAALAYLMDRRAPQSLASLRAGLAALLKAYGDHRSYLGESRVELFRILHQHEMWAAARLARIRGR